MNTLAECKRRIKTGIKIKLIDLEDKRIPHKYLNVMRTIGKVQTNGFYMQTNEQLAQGKHGSFIDYPKAGNYEGGGNSFRFVHPNFGYFDYELFEAVAV